MWAEPVEFQPYRELLWIWLAIYYSCYSSGRDNCLLSPSAGSEMEVYEEELKRLNPSETHPELGACLITRHHPVCTVWGGNKYAPHGHLLLPSDLSPQKHMLFNGPTQYVTLIPLKTRKGFDLRAIGVCVRSASQHSLRATPVQVVL